MRSPAVCSATASPSYKLEKDVIAAEIDVMREMGVEIKTGVEVGKDVTLKELREQGYKAFYIAIGCSAGRRPGVPGDDAEGTTTAIDYLREANTGKTSYTGRVVVVGGGNVAIDAARVSARSGAGEVHMLCLESEAEMPAADDEVREANEDGVKIQNGWGPKEVLAENGKVTGIILRSVPPSRTQRAASRRPMTKMRPSGLIVTASFSR